MREFAYQAVAPVAGFGGGDGAFCTGIGFGVGAPEALSTAFGAVIFSDDGFGTGAFSRGVLRLSRFNGAAVRDDICVSSVAGSAEIPAAAATALTGAGTCIIKRNGPRAAVTPGSRTTDGTRVPDTQIPFWLCRSTSV